MEGQAMKQRRTLNSLAFPDEVNQGNLPVEWAAGVSSQILQWTWLAFNRMKAEKLKQM